MTRKQKLHVVAAATAVCAATQFAHAAAPVNLYIDNFNRTNLNEVGTPQYSSLLYTTDGVTPQDGGISIQSTVTPTGNYLHFSNDTTANANSTGAIIVSTTTADFNDGTPNPYNLTLNTVGTDRVLDWTFNHQN